MLRGAVRAPHPPSGRNPFSSAPRSPCVPTLPRSLCIRAIPDLHLRQRCPAGPVEVGRHVRILEEMECLHEAIVSLLAHEGGVAVLRRYGDSPPVLDPIHHVGEFVASLHHVHDRHMAIPWHGGYMHVIKPLMHRTGSLCSDSDEAGRLLEVAHSPRPSDDVAALRCHGRQ